MEAIGDDLYRHLDMEESWLSDHPLVSTMVNIPVGEQESLAQAAAAAGKDRTHFKVKMGAFNVLSKFASQVGTNAPYVSLEEDSFKPLNQTVYLEIFDILISDALNFDELKTRTQKQEYFNTEKSKPVPDLDALVGRVLGILNNRTGTDLKQNSINSMVKFLGTLTDVKIIQNPESNEELITEGKLAGHIALNNQLIKAKKPFSDEQLGNMIKDVLQLGKKVKSNQQTVSKSRESVHKSLIDNVLNSNNMGGFSFTVQGDLKITDDGYNQSKKEFLRNVIGKFFGTSPEYPEVSICVCPEYDYDDDCGAEPKSGGAILKLSDNLCLFRGGFQKPLGDKITPNDNLCRAVFIQVHKEGINCTVTQEPIEMYYYDKDEDNYLKTKDTVDKLTITLTDETNNRTTSFVLFSVHLDSTSMKSYLKLGSEARYKKLLETYQLLRIISNQKHQDHQIIQNRNRKIFLVGDFNCAFEKPTSGSEYEYLNTFNLTKLMKEFNNISREKKMPLHTAKNSIIAESISGDKTLKFQPAIPNNNPGTPKNRFFGFTNAQAEKGDDLRTYNTDNIVLVNQGTPETQRISFSDQILTVKTNLSNSNPVRRPIILYPLFKEKPDTETQKARKILEETRKRNDLLLKAQGVQRARAKFGQSVAERTLELQAQAEQAQGGGSRKRNRKRNKKSLKKRNKRKSSRKKSKNPRKKRSKRR